MADISQIRPPDLGWADFGGQIVSDPSRLDEMTLEDIEKLLIKKALNRYGGKARRAAQALGLSRGTFYPRAEPQRVGRGKSAKTQNKRRQQVGFSKDTGQHTTNTQTTHSHI